MYGLTLVWDSDTTEVHSRRELAPSSSVTDHSLACLPQLLVPESAVEAHDYEWPMNIIR